MSAPASASAQTEAVCTGGRKLTLDVVEKLIQGRTEEVVVVNQIRACHVDFSLDAASMEELLNAGMTTFELEALNPETAARLTVEQARAEVAGLEARSVQPDPSLDAQRDAELRKIDSEYQADRAKSAKIDPKSEFESTADYNRRMRQSQAALIDLDRRHEAAMAQVRANYAAKVQAKNRPFQQRAEFLKRSEFAVAAAPVYIGYNADTLRLAAFIDGEEYWFYEVPAATARRLKAGWMHVAAAAPFADDVLKTRSLWLATAGIEVRGRSRSAEIAQVLQDAQHHMDQHDLDGAATIYRKVQAADPDNQTAKAGLEEVRSRKQEQQAKLEIRVRQRQAFFQGLDAAGIWLSTGGRLMWTKEPSQHALNWQEANNYCTALRMGGVAGWRLPTIDELKGLNVVAGHAHEVPKRPLKIGFGFMWSSTRTGPGDALDFDFIGEIVRAEALTKKLMMHAECVRLYQPATDGLDASQASGAARALPQGPLNRENPSSASPSDFAGTWVGTMHSSTGQSFPVTIRLSEIKAGDWCGTIHHPPPLDADGKLLCTKVGAGSMTVSQTITRGRERCFDGVNVLTLVDHDTMERVWIDPATGLGRDEGHLQRQKE